MPFSQITLYQIQCLLKPAAFALKGVETVFMDKYLSIAVRAPGLEITAKFRKLPVLIMCQLTFPVVGISTDSFQNPLTAADVMNNSSMISSRPLPI